MIYMTEELFEYNHRNFWLGLGKTGYPLKRLAPQFDFFDDKSIRDLLSPALLESVTNLCFACGSAFLQVPHPIDKCKVCPISWGYGAYHHCRSAFSEYTRWEYADTEAERKYWAGVIARLTWREGERHD